MIELTGVILHHGTSFELRGINLRVPTRSYGVLMGPTGCGKTTILEAICGLKPVARGTIRLAGLDVTKLKPAQRGVGYVPQDGALFSTMSVRENLAFALRVRRWRREAIGKRVDELAELLGIKVLLSRRTQGLSGGETQRVALGRALAARPAILCLDEPLSALDADARHGMYDLLRSVQSQTGVTTLHVTHDGHEAQQLANIRFRLNHGKIEAS